MQLTIDDLKALIGAGVHSCSFNVGEKYLIRSVTFYHTGRITAITDTDIVLTDAAWIASTGRFSDCLRTGEFDEVEPFVDEVIVARGAIIDATVWPHELPRAKK